MTGELRIVATLALRQLLTLLLQAANDASLAASADVAPSLGLRVSDIALEIPTRIAVSSPIAIGSEFEVMLELPSLRDTPEPGRLGRLNVSLARDDQAGQDTVVRQFADAKDDPPTPNARAVLARMP